MMVRCFAVDLMVKVLSLSALLTRAAIAWIRACRSQAVMIPRGRGVCRLHLQWLRLLVTPPVVIPSRSALKRASTLSLRSSGCAKELCRAGNGLIFTSSSENKLCSRRRRRAAVAGGRAGVAAAEGAGEGAGGVLTNKSSFTLL